MSETEVKDLKSQLDRIEAGLLQQKEVLTFDEACIYIGVSNSHLYKLTSNRSIPHYKPQGKMIYFRRSELDEWLLKNRIKTKEEINSEAMIYVITDKKQRKKIR